jgi:hypothetical protein
MQYNIGYILPNLVDVYIHTDGTVRRYEKVYERSIKLYKEVDNTFTLVVRNQDQKAQFVDGTSTVLQISDSNDKLQITKVGVVVDDGSSTSTKGHVKFTITESDMLKLKTGFYHGAIKHTDTSSTTQIVYADTRYDAAVRFEVVDKTFPALVDSTEISSFSLLEGKHISSTVTANANQNSNQALHTVAVYTNDFSGDLHVYGTLTPNMSYATDSHQSSFYKITTQTYSNASGVKYFNFTGVHTSVAFVFVQESGDSSTVLGGIDKLLYRS